MEKVGKHSNFFYLKILGYPCSVRMNQKIKDINRAKFLSEAINLLWFHGNMKWVLIIPLIPLYEESGTCVLSTFARPQLCAHSNSLQPLGFSSSICKMGMAKIPSHWFMVNFKGVNLYAPHIINTGEVFVIISIYKIKTVNKFHYYIQLWSWAVFYWKGLVCAIDKYKKD